MGDCLWLKIGNPQRSTGLLGWRDVQVQRGGVQRLRTSLGAEESLPQPGRFWSVTPRRKGAGTPWHQRCSSGRRGEQEAIRGRHCNNNNSLLFGSRPRVTNQDKRL